MMKISFYFDQAVSYYSYALEELQSIMAIKIERNGVVLAGDGRHDRMGHSVKYCAYSLFCCNNPINAIIDFNLAQVCFHLLIKPATFTFTYCIIPYCYCRSMNYILHIVFHIYYHLEK